MRNKIGHYLSRRAMLIGVLITVPATLAIVTANVGATSAPTASGARTGESVSVTLKLPLPAPATQALAAQESVPKEFETKASRIALAKLPAIAGDTEPVPPAAIAELSPDQGRWDGEVVEVRSGDTLARILARYGIGAATVHRLTTANSISASLSRIHPGQTMRLRLSPAGDLLEIIHETSAITGVRAWAAAGGFQAEPYEQPVESRVAYASGSITDSLYGAANDAGLSDRVTMELAEIFAWDVDFALDIRGGDRFLVVYEERYLNGEKLEDGEILAAEFVNQGHQIQAIRFVDDEGHSSYFSPDGRSMRKAFLRTPVKFSRISSRFSLARKHPVLHRIRAHKGVDYAAGTGTPIDASGDGKVAFIGTKGGYGKTIVLQHGQGYRTLYAHMSRTAKGLRTGSRVRQGEVIGYVGSSGLATGPHLHYEFQVNGAHKDPLTVKLPKAEPITERYRAAFSEIAVERLAQLQTVRSTQLAQND
jgi:murein DD-endopeptidase MepM/ murein hydrolase activator NlpD